MRAILIVAVAALALVACSKPAEKTTAAPAAKVEIPAGDYRLDPSHSTLVFKVDHLGFSKFTAQFAKFDAKLALDPQRLEAAQLDVTVDPRSLSLPSPPEGFKADLLGEAWLEADRHSVIAFRSTHVQPTGPDTALITGDLTLRGVTKPVVLQARFNGGWSGIALDPHARAGFSATGVFKRSDFGMAFGVPQPGTKMGVGDEVQVIVETEFTGPPLKT